MPAVEGTVARLRGRYRPRGWFGEVLAGPNFEGGAHGYLPVVNVTSSALEWSLRNDRKHLSGSECHVEWTRRALESAVV